jgi:GR25 family glycosyltransferase involved in LPS biosynthesis
MHRSAVLVIGYNRPDLLASSLSLLQGQCRNIYIHIDGPKSSHDLQCVSECIEIAEVFASKNEYVRIKSQCENLGCKYAPPAAINWAFEKEDSLIILEDDITFDSTFLSFMDWCLDFYEDDYSIWHVNGWNPLPSYLQDQSLYLSRFLHIWGWGTWKNRWKNYDVELEKYDESQLKHMFRNFDGFFFRRQLRITFKNMFDNIKNGFDTWDAQWLHAMLLAESLSVGFGQSLTGNVGFDHRATHTKNGENFTLKYTRNWSDSPWSHLQQMNSASDKNHALFGFYIHSKFSKFLMVKVRQFSLKCIHKATSIIFIYKKLIKQ